VKPEVVVAAERVVPGSQSTSTGGASGEERQALGDHLQVGVSIRCV